MSDEIDMLNHRTTKSVSSLRLFQIDGALMFNLLGVQQFAQTFCPQIVASASAQPTSQPTSSGSTIPSQSSISATGATIDSSSAAPASPTSSIVNLQDWGANFPGTNWQSTTNHSKADRGPAVEGVSITLFIIACLVVGFR